ncbi:MAG: cytochrome c [Candidatus Zixiibacteriota bacterium]
MSKNKKIAVILLVSIFAFTLVFTQILQSQPKEEKKKEPNAFEQKCSICHSLSDVREGMEKIITEMHDKAGVKISAKSLKEIEATFTLFPREEPEQQLFQQKCGSCHSIAVVVKAHQTMSDAEMKDVLKKMAEKKKSNISQEEVDKIHQSMNMLNEIYEKDVEVKPEK